MLPLVPLSPSKTVFKKPVWVQYFRKKRDGGGGLWENFCWGVLSVHLHLDSMFWWGQAVWMQLLPKQSPTGARDVGIHLLVSCSTSDSSGAQITRPDSWFQRLTCQSEHPRFAAVERELLLAWDHTWDVLWSLGLRSWPCQGLAWGCFMRCTSKSR